MLSASLKNSNFFHKTAARMAIPGRFYSKRSTTPVYSGLHQRNRIVKERSRLLAPEPEASYVQGRTVCRRARRQYAGQPALPGIEKQRLGFVCSGVLNRQAMINLERRAAIEVLMRPAVLVPETKDRELLVEFVEGVKHKPTGFPLQGSKNRSIFPFIQGEQTSVR